MAASQLNHEYVKFFYFCLYLAASIELHSILWTQESKLKEIPLLLTSELTWWNNIPKLHSKSNVFGSSNFLNGSITKNSTCSLRDASEVYFEISLIHRYSLCLEKEHKNVKEKRDKWKTNAFMHKYNSKKVNKDP